MNKNDFKKIKAFHGHLGPYVILGYRAGQIAKKILKEISKAEIFTRKMPPDSCFIDGVQLSTGCTIGCGRLKLVDETNFKKAVFFSKNKKSSFKIRQGVYPITLQKIQKLEDSKLFSITNY